MRIMSQNFSPESQVNVSAQALERPGSLQLTVDVADADDYPVGAVMDVELTVRPAPAEPIKRPART